MSYQVLARKWRPAEFKDVVGQRHVVEALSNALDNDRVHHAFLFTGTRGVGKTTLARIFAKALNCEQGVSSTPCGECSICKAVDEGRFVDLIEVDAASRTKVDDTRDLLDNVQYAPTQGRYKVYLIDEVHMLSTHSFNALLKTLEEPPEHVKFLLATTDPHKLPATILSRCIQFSLTALEFDQIAAQLEKILKAEGIQYESLALTTLARTANGSMRDALSLLDQSIAFSNENVTEASLRAMLNLIDSAFIAQIFDALAAGDGGILAKITQDMASQSANFANAIDDLISAVHAATLFLQAPKALQWKGLDQAAIARVAEQFDAETLQLFYQICVLGKRDFSLAPDPRTGFEMTLFRLLAFKPEVLRSGQSSGNSSPQSKPQERAKPNVVIAEKAADKEPNRSKPNSSPTVPTEVEPTASAKEKVDLTSVISTPESWAALVGRAQLSGLARQLAMHMVPDSLDGTQLRVRISEQYRQLNNQERRQEIESALRHLVGDSIRLEILMGEVDAGKTAAGVKAQRDKAELAEIQQTFQNDDAVQEMVNLFDAEVDINSIKRG